MTSLRVLLALGTLIASATPRLAQAGACGEIDGRSLPCACGDVLVGSRTLSADDPITQEPCEGDGLIVRIPAERTGVTLDLGGRTIRGTGRGMGLHLQTGGSIAITGPGTIRGFDIGILAGGSRVAIADVAAVENRSDGFRIAGTGFTVARCEARDNGGSGFSLRGHDYHVEANRAYGNGRDGFSLAGRRAIVAGDAPNESSSNGRNGVTIAGRAHVVGDLSVIGNGAAGLRARVAHSELAAPRATGNGIADVQAAGHDSVVHRSRRGESLRLRGARNRDRAEETGGRQ